MSGRMRVLQVITAFNDDAPAQSAALLAKYLNRDRFEVTAVSLRAQGGRASRTVADLEAAGIRHISVGMGGFFDLSAVARLIHLFRALAPAVVHSHAFRADLWCGIAGRIARVPLIVNTIRNHDAQVFRMERSFFVARAAVLASRVATSLADVVVAVSDGVAEYLRAEQRVPSAKVHVVRNGFDFSLLTASAGDRTAIRATMGWQPDDVIIGTLAILKPRKGLQYLLSAARDVLERHPRARFFIAGTGPDGPLLEAEIMRLGMADRFQLLGHRSDPLQLLHAADIYVLPSLVEGLPRSLLEAMALGKPVVVTDIGGSREVVTHGESGVVVEPADPAALGGAISDLVASAHLRARYGTAARAVVERQFDARRTAAAHETIYATLTARTGMPGAPRALERVAPTGGYHE